MSEQEVNELAQLRETIDATRRSLNELLHQTDMRSRRRANGVLAVVLLLASFVGYNAWSRHAESETACRNANETRAVIRDITKDASMAAGEALIEVASGANAETIALYRQALDKRLTDVVSRLGDRDC